VSAQAAAAEAIAAAARVASSPTAMNADVVKTAAREAAKKELKEELRAEIEAELRAEFEVSHRDTFVDTSRAFRFRGEVRRVGASRREVGSGSSVVGCQNGGDGAVLR
jgi:hypothetical protein